MSQMPPSGCGQEVLAGIEGGEGWPARNLAANPYFIKGAMAGEVSRTGTHHMRSCPLGHIAGSLLKVSGQADTSLY